MMKRSACISALLLTAIFALDPQLLVLSYHVLPTVGIPVRGPIAAATSSTRRCYATVLYSSLQDRTVSELWELVGGTHLMVRGLKSRLKRKQDLIDYIEEHGHGQDIPIQQDLALEHSDADGVIEEAEQEGSEEISNNVTTINASSEPLHQQEHQNRSDHGSSTQTLLPDIPSTITTLIPLELAQTMVQKRITSLLPIQAESFFRIFAGQDTVLQAPTGSGKTLAFVLPLLASQNKWRGRRKTCATPFVLVLTPSRELARQVGQQVTAFGSGSVKCATVYGGVPMERQMPVLKQKPQIVVSTPGRLRELVREKYLDYSQIVTVVLDEADVLLDKSDSPDVRAILDDLARAVGDRDNDDEAEYQLLLVSATINQHVVEFAREVGIPANALVRVQGTDSRQVLALASGHDHHVPNVQHWHTSCKATARPRITADLISIMRPKMTLVFVPTKTETETLASYLSTKVDGTVRILHGDMAQSARSRSIALIRETARTGKEAQVLVATDVASRGLDLDIDLVVQFGVPKVAGRDGTYSTELYIHRSGRTGRVRSGKASIASANAIMLWDPALGEGKLIPELVREVNDEIGALIAPKSIPSTAQVVEAGYERTATMLAHRGDNGVDGSDLVSYFKNRLETDDRIDCNNPQQLLKFLSYAMAALSNLDLSASPLHQRASLLSGSDTDRTLRLHRSDGEPLSPPEVTKYCKSVDPGKIGRVVICKDGSAVFDLPIKRAERLVEAAAGGDWELEIPVKLPAIE